MHPAPNAAFDLQLMMRAIPGSPSSPKLGRVDCFIRMLPNEVLGAIFDILVQQVDTERGIERECMGNRRSISKQGIASEPLTVETPAGAQTPTFHRQPLSVPLLLSHVSQHWRDVITSLPSHWTRIHIYRTDPPSVLSSILSRSKQRALDVSVHLPGPFAFLPPGVEDAFLALGEHAGRLKRLELHAPNSVLRILEKHLVPHILTQLEHLTLDLQFHSTQALYGPFIVNPECFISLRLVNAGFYPKDASLLGGIRELELVHASGRILEQRTLPSLGYPNSAIHRCMGDLSRLSLCDTLPMLPNPDTQSTPPSEYIPSFSSSNLKVLELSDITSTAYAPGPFLKLFIITYSPLLLELTLSRFSPHTMALFVGLVESPHPRFPCLRVLTLREMPLEAVGVPFLHAFPGMQKLVIEGVDEEPVMRLLRSDPQLCPAVDCIVMDGGEVRGRLLS